MSGNQPILTPAGPGRFRLVRDFNYMGFTVPEGFVCDLDSVPRIPFIHARYKGRTVAGAVLHDYLYKRQLVSRKLADLLFMDAMQLEGVPFRFRLPIYWGVRLFGWIGWWLNSRKST